MCKIHVDFFTRGHKQTCTATCARGAGACVPAFYYYPRSRYPRMRQRERYLNVLLLSSDPLHRWRCLETRRARAGFQVRAGHRNNERSRACVRP